MFCRSLHSPHLTGLEICWRVNWPTPFLQLNCHRFGRTVCEFIFVHFFYFESAGFCPNRRLRRKSGIDKSCIQSRQEERAKEKGTDTRKENIQIESLFFFLFLSPLPAKGKRTDCALRRAFPTSRLFFRPTRDL